MAWFFGKLDVLSGKRRNYKPVETEEEDEKRVQTSRQRYIDSPDPEATVGLLSDEPDSGSRFSSPKSTWETEESRLCMCCGVDFTLPLKIVGIVLLIAFLVGSYLLLKWAFYEPPVGLERLPEFGTSLGCRSAPYLLNNTKQILNVPLNTERYDHGIDIRGGAIGIVTLAEDTHGRDTIRYEVTLRSNDHGFLERSTISLPEVDASRNVVNSVITVSTPYIPEARRDLCIRYDIKMFIPRTLKKLHLASHTLTHVRFDPGARIKLEDFFVTLYADTPNNILQTATSVKADRMSLEVYRGWIVGDVSVVDETNIVTQRGDGVAYVNVYPEPPKDARNPEVALLETTTGAGRTDVFYHANKGARRPIDSTHISSKNGDVVLTYTDAKVHGLVNLEARRFDVKGVERLGPLEEGKMQWTHYAGSKDGEDKIVVSSRGWVGLYL